MLHRRNLAFLPQPRGNPGKQSRTTLSIIRALTPTERPAQGFKSRNRRCALMNRLAAILPASNVLVDVDASSKKRIFEQAGLLFENNHSISRALVTDNLFARERLGSTGLGHGVAIPHGRIKGLKNPLAAVLRVQQHIGFDAPDDEPVSLLIFLLVPEAATQRHLEILSEIAEMLSSAGPASKYIGPKIARQGVRQRVTLDIGNAADYWLLGSLKDAAQGRR